MNFSIDARGATLYNGSGIGTYINNLITEILAIDTNNTYNIFWSGDIPDYLNKPNSNIIFTSKKHGMFFENYYYPSYLKTHQISLHHIPQNGIGFSSYYDTPCVVTIHDLIPYIMPETVGPGYLERFLSDMPYIIKNSAGIITVSEYSKRDIMKFFPSFPAEKIYVTPLAANSNFMPLPKETCTDYLNKKYKIDFPFILYVGGFSKRKNVKELILSFKKIYSSLKKEHKLVILGSLKDEGLKLNQLCKDLFIDDKVFFTGFVPDEDLPNFYNAAELYVYPSLYEGFGLPILEAMSCKTPVITTNCSSIPEVAKNKSALLIDDISVDSLSTAMLTILNSPSLLSEYAEKGYHNSLDFTWKKTAEATINAYKNLSMQ